MHLKGGLGCIFNCKLGCSNAKSFLHAKQAYPTLSISWYAADTEEGGGGRGGGGGGGGGGRARWSGVKLTSPLCDLKINGYGWGEWLVIHFLNSYRENDFPSLEI